VPFYICPQCKERSVDVDAREGFSEQAPACRHCGFGFLFELLDDYYPAPNAAFFVCDAQARIIGVGRGVRELIGLGEENVMGRPVKEVLNLEFDEEGDPIGTALEWGVRVLQKTVTVHAEGDRPEPATADIFPAYDDDGGLLLVLTPN
jgi:PAS domain-containing protein